MKTAFVLAGGKGTRLGDALPPKGMLVVSGRTMLDRQLDWIEGEGFDNVVLCLGHRHDEVKFEKRKMNVVVSVEKAPLGTGGAIRQAVLSNLDLCRDGVYVLNVDDMARVDTKSVFEKSRSLDKSLIITKPLPFSVWVQNRMHPQNTAVQHIGHTFLKSADVAALKNLPDAFSIEKQVSEWCDRFDAFVHEGGWVTVNSGEQLEQAQKLVK